MLESISCLMKLLEVYRTGICPRSDAWRLKPARVDDFNLDELESQQEQTNIRAVTT